jgi:hypothetical protein
MPDCTCAMVKPESTDLPAINLVPPDLANKIRRFCMRFVNWWATVKQKDAGATELLALLMRTGALAAHEEANAGYAMHFAHTLAAFPHPWKHNIVLRKCTLHTWRARSSESTQDLHDVKASYRSTRRYIYRTYIRARRNCLRDVLRMDDIEPLCLNAEHFCSAAVAFVAWRIGHEPSSTILRAVPGRDGPAYAIKRYDVRHHSNFGSDAEHLYLEFIEIWSQIEWLIESTNVYITLLRSPDLEIQFPHARSSVQTIECERPGSCVLRILAPDPLALAAKARDRCVKRRRLAAGMIKLSAYWSYHSFGWVHSNNGTLFKIKRYDINSSNSYINIMV